MTPMASRLLPAPPFVSISDVRHLQLPPRGRHRPRLCWRGVEWGSVQTRMVSSFVGCRTRRRNVICASLFGVGAPEALVIGVVALLVFGPKGLAEVARNLRKTLRAFQPTIREIQDVSREFRSTLEREIGIDEVSQSTNYRPTTMNNNQPPAADPIHSLYPDDQLGLYPPPPPTTNPHGGYGYQYQGYFGEAANPPYAGSWPKQRGAPSDGGPFYYQDDAELPTASPSSEDVLLGCAAAACWSIAASAATEEDGERGES